MMQQERIVIEKLQVLLKKEAGIAIKLVMKNGYFPLVTHSSGQANSAKSSTIFIAF